MKGFIYLIFIYLVAFSLTILTKIILKDKRQKNKGEPTPAPQIFYIKNAVRKRKKSPPKPTDITIKGTIVDNED